MPVAMVDGLEVNCESRGSGAPLLMMAPGGFDASMDKWLTTTAWKGINAPEKLAAEFQIIVYDRRESGKSGGRVEKLRWELYAEQAKGLLDHLKIDAAIVMGGLHGLLGSSGFCSLLSGGDARPRPPLAGRRLPMEGQ